MRRKTHGSRDFQTADFPLSAGFFRASTRETSTWHTHARLTLPYRRLSRQQILRASTRQHTHRHTHSHHKTPVLFCSLLGPSCSSHESSRLIFLQPLSPVVHASLIQSPENLRNAPVPPHTVYYSSTRRSPTNTNLFTFLPDAQTPGCPPPTLHFALLHRMVQCETCEFLHYLVGCVLAGKRGGVGLTLPSHPSPPPLLPSAPVAAVYRLYHSETK